MARRSFLGFLAGGGAATAAGCMIGEGEVPVLSNETWEARASQLEAASQTVYTAAAPGMWAGKEGTHVPRITFDPDGSITVSSTHGMVQDHWITTLFVRDQDGKVIHLEELPGRGPAIGPARTTFVPRVDTRTITAYAYCNLHDLWAGAPQSVG